MLIMITYECRLHCNLLYYYIQARSFKKDIHDSEVLKLLQSTCADTAAVPRGAKCNIHHSLVHSFVTVLSNTATNVLCKANKAGTQAVVPSTTVRQSILPSETILITITHQSMAEDYEPCSTSLLPYLFIIIANHCLMKQ